MEIAKPSSNRFLKALIYGPSGAGKTRLLGSLQDDPRTSPALILDVEDGLDTLSGKDIDTVRVTSNKDFTDVYRHLSSPHNTYKSVAFDSLTETQQLGLLEILKAEEGARRDKDVLQQQDYGKSLMMMRRLARLFRDLPLHVIFTARAKEEADPREGMVKLPRFVGAFTDDITALVDVVGYLAISADKEDKAKRVLLLANQARFRTKVRTPYDIEVPDLLENPTMGKLLDTLRYEQPH